MTGRDLRAMRPVALCLALALAAPAPLTAGARPPAVAAAPAVAGAAPDTGAPPAPGAPPAARVDDPGAPPADPRTLSYAPLRISFPKPERALLPNGLLVYLFEDHELPLVDVTIDFKAGSIFDPPDRAGLASLAATLMRTGGTETMAPDAVDEALEFMAVQISLSASADRLSGSVSAVKDRFPEALRIFASLLREPRFDAARLEVEKAREIEEIRRRYDDPADLADLDFRRLVYGASSPWARLSTVESIGRIGRDDLVEWQRRYVRPNNAVMGVAGDFAAKKMKGLLEETFRGWSNAKVTPPPVARVKDDIPAGVHLLTRPLSQTRVEIGHLGVGRFEPDKFAIKILNFILGEGGFTSRLVKEVRSTRGLAYSIGGGIGLDSDRGLFQISGSTKAGSTVEAIDLVRGILRQMREEGPAEQEVREAKEAIINSFVFSVDGTAPFMRAFLYYDFYGYPPDYLRTYRDNLAKVTRGQVAQAARKRLDPDRLVILVVGNDKEFDRPLSSLGLGEPRPVRLHAEPAAAPSGH
ncbi:MAG: insulinase family protein [Acidobacteria bacterium]|nr:insulinase family protein [Acidobacteriota bacterium]